MTLFRRINDIFTANLNDLVDRFEDPEKMLRQAIREMDDAIAATTTAAARCIAGTRLLEKEIASRRAHAVRWQRSAVAAVAAGDDEQARRSLTRRREHERFIAALEEQSAAADEMSTRLRRRIEAMKVKRADAGRMLIELAARQFVVQANRRFGDVALCDASTRVFYRFERLRKRVELAETEAEAALELTGDDDSLADRDYEETAAIEVELLELKQGRAPE
jgi:phage shock protein A